MVQLGIDFDPRPYQPAALCYYYGTHDLEDSIDRLRAGDYHEGKEGFLIYVPSLHSPELAGLARGTPLAAALQGVSAAVARYDFDAALEALRTVEEAERARG